MHWLETEKITWDRVQHILSQAWTQHPVESLCIFNTGFILRVQTFNSEIVLISAECCINIISLSRDGVWKFPVSAAIFVDTHFYQSKITRLDHTHLPFLFFPPPLVFLLPESVQDRTQQAIWKHKLLKQFLFISIENGRRCTSTEEQPSSTVSHALQMGAHSTCLSFFPNHSCVTTAASFSPGLSPSLPVQTCWPADKHLPAYSGSHAWSRLLTCRQTPPCFTRITAVSCLIQPLTSVRTRPHKKVSGRKLAVSYVSCCVVFVFCFVVAVVCLWNRIIIFYPSELYVCFQQVGICTFWNVFCFTVSWLLAFVKTIIIFQTTTRLLAFGLLM